MIHLKFLLSNFLYLLRIFYLGGCMKVVIVDDLTKNLKLYTEVLEHEFELELYSSPEEAIKTIPNFNCDLVLLDWNMPVLNGLEVLKNLRAAKPLTPVIMITGEYLERNLIEALNFGAEDFIVKPISNAELIARIKNKIAKAKVRLKMGHTEQRDNITFDDDLMVIKINDQEIQLQNKEYRVLRYLARFERKLVSREEIMEQIWHAPGINSTTLDTHLSILRRKLGEFSGMIITKKGHGYIYDPTEIENTPNKIVNKRDIFE